MMGLLIVILLIIILWYLFDFNLYLFGIITIINIFVLDLIQSDFVSDFVSDFDFKILPNKIGGGDTVGKSYRIKNHFVSDEFKLLPEYVQKMLLKDKFSLSHTIKEDFSFHPFSRIINDDSPRLKYTKPTPEIAYKPQVHWGQLKLMLSEVEFLTLVYKQYKESGDTRPIYIVYAGAAPGHHIDYLHSMFPDIYFYLYDPNDFVAKENDKVKTFVQFFMDEDAKKWKDDSKYVCLISDIRTFPATEENIVDNMNLQKGWWDIMNPELSMFKFRLPWNEGKTEYMEGDIYLQVYPPITSTETRLIVKKDAKMKIYDHKIYEEQCFYHNVNRNKQFKNVLKLDLEIENKYLPHMDMCYDCTAFIYIVNEYIKYFDSENLSNERVIEKTLDIENNIWENKDLRTQKILQIHDMKGRLYSQFLKHCHNYNKCNICNYSNLKKQHVEDLDFNLKRKHGHETQNLN